MAGYNNYNPKRYKTRTHSDELQSDDVRKIVQLNARISFLERALDQRDKQINHLESEVLRLERELASRG